MEHQITNCILKNNATWPVVQLSDHPVIQKGDGNAESDVNSGRPDVQGHPMRVSKLPMLTTATTEEETLTMVNGIQM